IAKIFDAGESEQGRPYFVMELVSGQPVTSFCDRRKLSLRKRIQLFVQICAGVQHAHMKGVMHRDLKPGNVLVHDKGGEAQPKIIDFGLARATDQRLTELSLYTEQGQLIGTPEYMSPEQAGFGGQDVDTRTDVYSLGVLLFELLTGDLPLGAMRLRNAGLLEMQRLIREEDPGRPSTRITKLGAQSSEIAALRACDEKALRSALRKDLDWIVLKAIEKDRDRRYASPAELAEDLQRHLAGDPVEAHPPSSRYKFQKFIAKHRAASLATLAVLISLVLGLSLALWQYERAETRAREASENLASFKRLADARRFAGLQKRANLDLWPAMPARVPAMNAWLEDARQLAARLPQHQASLEQALHDEQNEVEDPVALAWQAEILTKLISDVEVMKDPDRGLLKEVEARVAKAAEIEAYFENDRDNWAATRAAIEAADGERASRLYAGMSLDPIVGLTPVGSDPVSGFHEFGHLGSGKAPKRDPVTKKLQLLPETGLVFVFLPGGRVRMGAQSTDPELPYYDARALPNEASSLKQVVEVTLEPFFISKYEMTQEQWERVMGENPSQFTKKIGGTEEKLVLHPIENVTYIQCAEALRRLGLQFPTEAQWEYAARGGTTTPWWTGKDRETLKGAVNLMDKTYADARGEGWEGAETWLDDGFLIHAPVHALRPNPFGLYHVLGNVAEWCLDASVSYDQPADAGTGLRRQDGAEGRQTRGGDWSAKLEAVRASVRFPLHEHSNGGSLGLRPVLRLSGMPK
ncbi:MAG: SUMF1/EgtB/PvdO family nonheme iron enzyme, partial [Planctomycetes bacterium]|nr:SUMF1/EgtB/PvdO family nonheme iron enzyme [Planctomycetota bacterium]